MLDVSLSEYHYKYPSVCCDSLPLPWMRREGYLSLTRSPIIELMHLIIKIGKSIVGRSRK